MSQPTSIDFLTPFDPTGYSSITGAQLEQLVGGLAPNSGIGLVVQSTDTAGVPNVPNANSVVKWQNYIWLRLTATAAIPYIWNPNAASDVTYLKWQTVAASSIGVGTITGAMIATNTITDSNIANVSYSKLIGNPTGLPPTGAAGGDLTGNYPNPSIANAAITGAKIALNTIVGGAGGNLVAKTINPVTDMAPSGTGLAYLRTNTGATATEWGVLTDIAASANLAVAGNGLKVPQVNTGGTAYQLTAPNTSAFGRILQVVQGNSSSKLSSVGSVSTASTPNYNATGMNAFFSQAITVISAASKIRIQGAFQITCPGNGYGFVGIYPATGATAPIAFQAISSGAPVNTALGLFVFDTIINSPGVGVITYYVAFGATTGTVYTNSIDGATSLFGGLSSYLTLTEII